MAKKSKKSEYKLKEKKNTTKSRNIIRSLKDVSIATISELAPNAASIIRDNKEYIKTNYQTAKNDKFKEIKNTLTTDVNNIIKNFKDDIKSGTFYNKEREDKETMRAFGMDDDFFNDDDDFSEGNFVINDENDDIFSDDNDSFEDNGNTFITNKKVKNTKNYFVSDSSSSLKSIKAMSSLGEAIIRSNSSGFSAVNDTLSQIYNFHNEHTLNFYNEFSDKISSIGERLEDMAKVISSSALLDTIESKNESSNFDLLHSSMFSIESLLTIYKRQNMGSMLGLIKDFIPMLKSTVISNPVGTLAKMGLKALIPKNVKKTIESFDDSLEFLPFVLMNSLTNMSNSKGLLGKISRKITGSSFFPDLSFNTEEARLSLRSENKALTFDTDTKRAIVEVIPKFLGDILSTLSGKDALRFDYRSGTYVTDKHIVSTIKRERTNILSGYAEDSSVREAIQFGTALYNDKNKTKHSVSDIKEGLAQIQEERGNTPIITYMRQVIDSGNFDPNDPKYIASSVMLDYFSKAKPKEVSRFMTNMNSAANSTITWERKLTEDPTARQVINSYLPGTEILGIQSNEEKIKKLERKLKNYKGNKNSKEYLQLRSEYNSLIGNDEIDINDEFTKKRIKSNLEGYDEDDYEPYYSNKWFGRVAKFFSDKSRNSKFGSKMEKAENYLYNLAHELQYGNADEVEAKIGKKISPLSNYNKKHENTYSGSNYQSYDRSRTTMFNRINNEEKTSSAISKNQKEEQIENNNFLLDSLRDPEKPIPVYIVSEGFNIKKSRQKRKNKKDNKSKQEKINDTLKDEIQPLLNQNDLNEEENINTTKKRNKKRFSLSKLVNPFSLSKKSQKGAILLSNVTGKNIFPYDVEQHKDLYDIDQEIHNIRQKENLSADDHKRLNELKRSRNSYLKENNVEFNKNKNLKEVYKQNKERIQNKDFNLFKKEGKISNRDIKKYGNKWTRKNKELNDAFSKSIKLNKRADNVKNLQHILENAAENMDDDHYFRKAFTYRGAARVAKLSKIADKKASKASKKANRKLKHFNKHKNDEDLIDDEELKERKNKDKKDKELKGLEKQRDKLLKKQGKLEDDFQKKKDKIAKIEGKGYNDVKKNKKLAKANMKAGKANLKLKRGSRKTKKNLSKIAKLDSSLLSEEELQKAKEYDKEKEERDKKIQEAKDRQKERLEGYMNRRKEDLANMASKMNGQAVGTAVAGQAGNISGNYMRQSVLSQRLNKISPGLGDQLSMKVGEKVDAKTSNLLLGKEDENGNRSGGLLGKGKKAVGKIADKLKDSNVGEKVGNLLKNIGGVMKGAISALKTALTAIPFGRVLGIGLGAAAIAALGVFAYKKIKGVEKGRDEKVSFADAIKNKFSKIKANKEEKKQEKEEKKEKKKKASEGIFKGLKKPIVDFLAKRKKTTRYIIAATLTGALAINPLTALAVPVIWSAVKDANKKDSSEKEEEDSEKQEKAEDGSIKRTLREINKKAEEIFTANEMLQMAQEFKNEKALRRFAPFVVDKLRKEKDKRKAQDDEITNENQRNNILSDYTSGNGFSAPSSSSSSSSGGGGGKGGSSASIGGGAGGLIDTLSNIGAKLGGNLPSLGGGGGSGSSINYEKTDNYPIYEKLDIIINDFEKLNDIESKSLDTLERILESLSNSRPSGIDLNFNLDSDNYNPLLRGI